MKNWTTQATERLSEYLQERVERERFEGEDAAELKEDLRRHIHEEAERSGSGEIGLAVLEQLLGRLDAGYRPLVVESGERESVSEWRHQRSVRRGRWLCWTFGVVLPLAILVFEWLSAFCGSVFFDPVPTWWHAGLVALVPGLNAWLLRGGGSAKWRGAAAGFALATAGFYGLLFLPLLPASVIALMFVGLGLLSLMPIIATLVTWWIGRVAWHAPKPSPAFKSGWRLGMVAAVVVLTALEGPALWTRINLVAALSDGKGATSAVARLRMFHSERSLLKACYEGNRGTMRTMDISGWLTTSWQIPLAMLGRNQWDTIDTEQARDVFFRVTGKPFNSVQPPRSVRSNAMTSRRGGNVLEDFEFDGYRGSDQVAVRLKNLDLAQSRFDGHLDAVSRIGYGEWTLVFKNSGSEVKEARCQMRLPHGGRVSRLTLWVNGEAREAAFSTVAKVKAAYKSVAVVQRRDPVLVNMVGPDTVMVQCFPVPAHGEMKIRLGVSAPLDGSRWELPHLVECNFGLPDDLEHAVWLQGNRAFEVNRAGQPPAAAQHDGTGFSLPVALHGAQVLAGGVAWCATALPTLPEVVWCEDRFAKPEERILIREPITVPRPACPRQVVVIDGSQSMVQTKPWLTAALASVAPERLVLFVADDQAHPVSMAGLQNYHFSGGRDNEPALREAVRLAKESGGSVVWIHGPQAVGLTKSEALLQLLERGTVHPMIYEVEAVAGPNRLAEAIYQSGCLRRGPALIDAQADLARFLRDQGLERQEIGWHWKRAASAEGQPGQQVWDQLARLWAATEVESPAAMLEQPARAKLAASYQLVTPYSGAVVLETKAQYDEHGLTPVEGDATPQIPAVPEPSSSLLILLAITAAVMRRRR